MEILRLLSLRKKDAMLLEIRVQIGPAQRRYLVPFQEGEFRLFDFPEELRRVLRQQPAVSWRLMETLTDFLDGNQVLLPLSLASMETGQREAA